LYKRIPERALHGIANFFRGPVSSTVLIQTADVKTPAGNGHGRSDFFPSTHWSVVAAAGESQAEPEIAQAALAELCQTYWAPLYSFVRSRGYAVEDAQDLTQSFFAYLIEHKIYARADRTKGKFRSFLLASLKNFLGHAYDRDKTLKRGGSLDFLPLDEGRAKAAESLFQTHFVSAEPAGEDGVFERTWAEALVRVGLERLEAEQKAEGKHKLFEELRIFLTSSPNPLPTYDDLGLRLSLPPSTLRSRVKRLRARYRELLRAEVRRTVGTEAEVEGELHWLFRVLAGE
jgi:DNA-directed RNA polymerase specialized sigma24 family protein